MPNLGASFEIFRVPDNFFLETLRVYYTQFFYFEGKLYPVSRKLERFNFSGSQLGMVSPYVTRLLLTALLGCTFKVVGEDRSATNRK